MNSGMTSTRGNILAVDDNPDNLNLLTRMLSRQGYKVRVAPSGKLALISAQSTPPDLIVLDVMMPDMDGFIVCQQLKANENTRDIPVIFISALDGAFDKAKAFTVGGVDYITKPFEPIEVIARIESQLRLREFQLQLQTKNAHLELLLNTTCAINEASDIDTALQIVLANICQQSGWAFGEAWMLNSSKNTLECVAFWHSQMESLATLPACTRTCTALSPELFLGRIWLSKQTEWITDLSQADNLGSLLCPMLQPSDLKSVLGVPIVFGEQVVAVLMFFHYAPLSKQSQTLELVNAIAVQLGALIRRKQAEEKLRQINLELERLATLDGLTQVANRRQFDAYLDQEWRRLAREKNPLALILCDVDYFKAYNDYYGHQAGDDCLRQVAQAIDQAIRRPADLAARYGGEEFAVILPNTTASGAMTVAESIRAAIAGLRIHHAHSQISGWLTISMGVSSYPPTPETSLETLIAIADAALYAAKDQGRDRIVYLDLPHS